MPEGTELTPLNPMPEGTFSPARHVRPWDTLSDDEKRLFARMAEVYAGFCEYTDHQVGRIIDYLEQTGQLDNTLILYCADNGASGEGGPDGSVNENKFFNGWPDDIAENLKHLDDLGSPNTYNHYPTGWAAAFSTPFKMFKRYSLRRRRLRPARHPLAEGVRRPRRGPPPVPPRHRRLPDDPRLLRRRDARGRRRRQQVPLAGTSMRYSFDADGPDAARAASTTACSARAGCGRTAGRSSPSTARPRASATSTRTCGSSSTSTRTARRPATSPTEHPERSKRARRALVRGGGEVRRAPARRPPARRDHRRRAAAGRAAARDLRLLPRHRRGPRVGGREHPRPVVSRPGRGRPHEPRGRRGDLRPRLALRRPRPVPARSRSSLRLQLPRPPARADLRVRRLEPGRHVLGMEFTRESAGEHGESHGTTRLYVDDRSSPKARCGPSPASSRCAATGSASAATRATR